MNTEELRLLQTLNGLRQSLNDLTAAHNTLFKESEDRIAESDIRFTVIDDEIVALQSASTTQRQKISDFEGTAKDTNLRLSTIERDLEDARFDIKRLEKELSAYQRNCGRTITEILMRLNVLEGADTKAINHDPHPSDQK